MTATMRVSKSIVGDAEIAAVNDVLRRGYLGMGAEVKRFEDELEAYVGGGAKAACVNTGTAALHLALQAVGVGPGDEVLVPSLTFVASFQAVTATGATPIPCDVRERDGLLDLDDAARRITARTKVLMPVHYASQLGDPEATVTFASRHGLRVVEDAAHSFGCSYRGKRIGAFGDVVAFSFDGIKNITSGEGGAVVTRDAEVLSRVRDARLLGVEKDSERRYAGERSWEFDVTRQGWRYHMSDLMAAIGRVQLRRLEAEFVPKRRRLAHTYREQFAGVAGLSLFEAQFEHGIVPFMLPIRITNGRRDAARAALGEAGIESGIHYKPSHLLTRFRREGAAPLPVAESLYRELLTLPLHPELTETDVARVAAHVRKIVS